jgi:hypothetical protein
MTTTTSKTHIPAPVEIQQQQQQQQSQQQSQENLDLVTNAFSNGFAMTGHGNPNGVMSTASKTRSRVFASSPPPLSSSSYPAHLNEKIE